MHETGIHGGPPARVVGAIAAVALVFGTIVLVAEAFGGDERGATAAATQPAAGEQPTRCGGWRSPTTA